MKLQEWLDIYQESSKQVSDLTRQLAMGAIAIVWIFNKDNGDGPVLAAQLVQVAFLAISTLAVDFLQHLAKAFLVGEFFRNHDKNGTPLSRDVRLPGWRSRLIWLLFLAKIVTLCLCYVLLLTFLSGRIGSV